MQNIKTFEGFGLNNDNLKILSKIAKNVRDYINNKYNLAGSFVNYCDLTSEEISKRLKNNNISGKIVYGNYLHQYENSEPEFYGHTWVETENYIIDASREQFDSFDYVIHQKDADSEKYTVKKIINFF